MLPKMLEWYHDGDFPVDQLIQEYAFEHINEACAAMCSGEVIKPVIVFLTRGKSYALNQNVEKFINQTRPLLIGDRWLETDEVIDG